MNTSINTNPKKFDEEHVKLLCELTFQIAEELSLTDVEIAFGLSSMLKSLGLHLYDKGDVSYAALCEDYAERPSWPAALMIHAEQIINIYNMYFSNSATSLNLEAQKE